MSIIVYSPDFNEFHEIANATSVQMSYYYNGIGKLILDVPINADNVEALKNDRILYDTVKKLAFIIKNVKTDTSKNCITANGYTTNQILNSRVIASPVAITNIENGVYSVVANNLRGLTRIALAPSKGLTEQTGITLYGEALLDELVPVLTDAGLGNRMVWNHRSKEHTFEIYKGTDLTTGLRAVVFSDEQGTARGLVMQDDASTFKNVAYVISEYDEKEVYEVVGTATGDDRHEMWFETSLPLEKNETEAHYRERLRNHGAMELGKKIRAMSFNVTIDPTELGESYNIGDIVVCVSKRFGVRFNARIAGVKFTKDSRGEKTEIVLSEPNLIKLGEVILSG